MFASCGEKITNHKFFCNQVATQNRQPSCNQQEFFCVQSTSIKVFFIAKTGTICIFGFIFSATPHDYDFFCIAD
jgi:hypothetical protein